ncbi:MULTISPECIES: hypothetical protein [unclassified Erwinia]|uniref:hypothetical protein n=1 Tax=unclassified Erwinia TaxID=2622719 RepID=UPI000700D5C5|nr:MULTISPECIES: hypothetical protein [unclassified Erwinia]KQN63755.1 hypothetical protein ASF13_19465 [Erwinia sp. Leaf53]PLV57889.1 hypothetical protein NV64_15100 [Erwinia sp. B116]
MRAVSEQQAEKIVGGWDPFGAALSGARKCFDVGNKILGPLGGTVTGALGFLGGLIAGLVSA